MLKLRIKIKGKKLYYSIPLWGKIPYAVVVAVVLYGLLSFWEAPLVPIIIGSLSLLGLLYRESWIFDNQKKTITGIFGVGPFVQKQIINYDDVDKLQLVHFLRGTMDSEEDYEKGQLGKKRKSRKKAIISFEAKLVTDDVVKIEIIEENKSAGRTEEACRAIAVFTNLDYEADREPEKGPSLKISDLPKGGLFR